MPSSPTTRTDQAYRQLRSMVLNGEYKPGHWLRKRTVADHLNMSPTPVVEAFRLLEQEGLVEVVPKWGVRVRALTCDEIEQILWMRSDIEARVARRIAERAGELGRQLDDLDRLAQEADDAVRTVLADRDHLTGRVGQTVEPDLRFHIQLAHRSGLRLMAAETSRLFSLGQCIRMLTTTDRLRVPHREIVTAIRSGDPAQAETVMRRHIEGKLLYDLPQLRERFGDGPIRFDAEDETEEANNNEPARRLIPAGN